MEYGVVKKADYFNDKIGDIRSNNGPNLELSKVQFILKTSPSSLSMESDANLAHTLELSVLVLGSLYSAIKCNQSFESCLHNPRLKITTTICNDSCFFCPVDGYLSNGTREEESVTSTTNQS